MSKLGTWWRLALAAILAVGIAGCGAAPAPMSAPAQSAPPSGAKAADMYTPASPAGPMSQPGYGGGAEAESNQAAPSSAPPGAAKSDAVGGARRDEGRARSAEPQQEARPGLGTGWGETRESRTTTAPFVRDNATNPFNVAAIYYNDREGANAMARQSDYRAYERNSVPVLGGALTVTLRDERGSVLPGFASGGRNYAVGEPGQRYIVVITNNTRYRFECVATVDGLDVIDGQPGNFSKRGYLIQPYGTLEIDGWRRSADQVAAFRFSSVRGSYSGKSGQGTANVGVIGVALFNERGTNPTWTQEEINRRHQADPFPGRYAVPPSN